MHAVANSPDQQCPSCHAHFRVADRRKRVQCPHCLAVVNLAPAKKPEGVRSPALLTIELEELKERVGRVEDLAARIAAMERMLAASTAAPPVEPLPSAEFDPPANVPPLETPPPLWTEPPQRARPSNAAEIDADRESALIASLAAIGKRRIAIQCSAGDVNARRLASRLHEIYRRAGWEVRSFGAVADPAPSHSMALLTNSTQPARDLALHFTALSSAGFHVVSQIDPNSDEQDPILIVGPQG